MKLINPITLFVLPLAFLILPSACGKKNKTSDDFNSRHLEKLQACATDALCTSRPCEMEVNSNHHVMADCKQVTMTDERSGKRLDAWYEIKSMTTDNSGEVIHTTMRIYK